MVSGHRLSKLSNYSTTYIKLALDDIISNNKYLFSYAYSGMADGVDLWFCQLCVDYNIPYSACVPFVTHGEFINKDVVDLRQELLKKADKTLLVKNSFMVEKCDCAIVCWDGNKGGTHNVLQQLVENKKPFYWINPVSEIIYNCT